MLDPEEYDRRFADFHFLQPGQYWPDGSTEPKKLSQEEWNRRFRDVNILQLGQTWPDGTREPKTLTSRDWNARFGPDSKFGLPAQPVQPAQPFNSHLCQLSEKALYDKLDVLKAHAIPSTPQPPVKLEDAAALDALTNIRKFRVSFMPEYVVTPMIKLLMPLQHGMCVRVYGVENGKKTPTYTVHTLVQLSDWPNEEWTERQEQAYVQSVLKSLVKPRFIVNVLRGQGRLLSGVCRLKALIKWLRNQLPVMINGTAVRRLELPDADREHFDSTAIRVTLYTHLTKADELELLQSMACPAWQ